MTFSRTEYRRLRPLLDEAASAVVVTHVNPDGDGVGSGVALSRFLAARGIDARFLVSAPLPAGLRFLEAHHPVVPYDGSDREMVRRADLLFTVDNSSVSRLGPLEGDVRATDARKICIDHHLVRNEFWDLNLIDESAAATGVMIHDLVEELGGDLDLGMAEALYVAIATDTGRFRFPKTSASIHRRVAAYLDLGVRPERVYHEVHERNTPAFMRLMAEALLRVQSTADGRLSWVELPASLVDACGAHDEDTSEVINQMLAVDGVEIGLLFRELTGGRTKISLRSKPQHDVNALATANGGGGHRNAAGAVVEEPLETCARRLVAEAAALLG